VGAPVAAPIVQPIREAAEKAVATQLPARQSVMASDAGASARYQANVANPSVSNQVIIDRDAGAIVYQVVDNRTSWWYDSFPRKRCCAAVPISARST